MSFATSAMGQEARTGKLRRVAVLVAVVGRADTSRDFFALRALSPLAPARGGESAIHARNAVGEAGGGGRKPSTPKFPPELKTELAFALQVSVKLAYTAAPRETCILCSGSKNTPSSSVRGTISIAWFLFPIRRLLSVRKSRCRHLKASRR